VICGTWEEYDADSKLNDPPVKLPPRRPVMARRTVWSKQGANDFKMRHFGGPQSFARIAELPD
jgi:hypothetical protein